MVYGFIGLMGSLQLSGFPLHPVLSGVLTFFDRDGPTVSKISHRLRKGCRISERLPECKRVQRVIGHFIPVSVSDGYTKVPRFPKAPNRWPAFRWQGSEMLGTGGDQCGMGQGVSGDGISFSSLFFNSLIRWSAPAIASEMRLSIDQSP